MRKNEMKQELYTYWAKLIGENIKPEFMLCGHKHKTLVSYPGSELDQKGQPCPVVIGSDPHKKEEGPDRFDGCAIIYENGKVTVKFTDQDQNLIGEEIFEI